MRQPDIEGAKGNPAVLYFLERDINEMQRLTQGKANYFRKRIRMAIYQGASIKNVTLPYRGRPAGRTCATSMAHLPSSRGRGTGSARPQAQRPPRGWSLRLRTCLSRFGQATEAKPLASGGLQGAANHTQWGAWGLPSY